MKKITVCVVACALLGLFMVSVYAAVAADEGAAPEAKAERVKREKPAKPEGVKPEGVKPVMQEITVVGLLEGKEIVRKGKDGQEAKMLVYTVTEADGTVVKLPHVAPGKDGAVGIDLSQYAGQSVTVTGMGMTKTVGEGEKARKQTMLRQITAIKAQAAVEE